MSPEKMVKKPNENIGNGSSEWHKNRLRSALKLIAILPSFPGLTVKEMCEELDLSRRAVYALVAVLRESDIKIESQFDAKGYKVYFLKKRPQELMDKLFGS
jgi:predicted DNA-binding transcriptional regulator YafY